MPTAPLLHYVVVEVPNITPNTAFLGIFKGLTGLEINYDVLEYREGGNNDFVHHLPGRMRYPNLVLSWGIVSDEILLQWFMATHQQAQTAGDHADADRGTRDEGGPPCASSRSSTPSRSAGRART